ncbi:hypothetical protein MTO96_031085 [Rhipicephalus appendiculatus]
MYGMRVIVQSKLRNLVLDEHYEGHPGIVRCKELAQSYVWWSSIEAALEHRVKKTKIINFLFLVRTVESIIKRYPEKEPRFVSIDYIPLKFTRPYITKDQWVNAFSKYTNNTYTAVDPVYFQEAAVRVLVDMLKSESLGAKGLQYLIAWSVYTQLVKYTVPNLLLDGNSAAAACYVHAKKAMNLALVSPFLQKVLPAMLQAVKTMVSNIRPGLPCHT